MKARRFDVLDSALAQAQIRDAEERTALFARQGGTQCVLTKAWRMRHGCCLGVRPKPNVHVVCPLCMLHAWLRVRTSRRQRVCPSLSPSPLAWVF